MLMIDSKETIMPDLYTVSSHLEEPVTAFFRCEFCNHEFSRTGKISVDVKSESLFRPTDDSKLGVFNSAQAKLLSVHAQIDDFLNHGLFPQRWSDEKARLHFNGSNKCPECGYFQRIAEKRKTPWTFKRIFAFFWFLTMPAVIYGVVFYALISSFIESKTPRDLIIAILMIAILPVIFLIIRHLKNRNLGFMKKHGLKKENLPAPNKPQIIYEAAAGKN
jgi:hypothetical protein